ncbi:MAG: DUF839 domain-containing protein, partial [Bacteroidia bacterium]|nr:DUF839 domain-containing protein [Bacteroidia bacterium]
DDVNPGTFVLTSPFNVSARPTLADSVAWAVPAGSWTAIGQNGPDQRTPDLTALVQALVNKAGWASGNAMVFTVKGEGLREAESQDGSPSGAARLVVSYLSSGPVINPVTDYPVAKKSDWSYLDDGSSPAAWTALAFNDTVWSVGKAPLGYGDNDVETSISFGSNPAQKHVTSFFRKRFNIADVTALTSNVEMQLRVDDGAVVYINNTEVARVNMPTGSITSTTLAAQSVEGDTEKPYFVFDVPATAFVNGENIVAVEVHQVSGASDDKFFDLALNNRQYSSNSPALGCNGPTDEHISCFTSVIPREQNDTLDIPSDHQFQFLASEGESYVGSTGTYPSNFDFTGFVPVGPTRYEGYVSINHERSVGGVSIARVHLDFETGLWVIDASGPVDFSGVAGTTANCSGTVTPWNTVVTCEEATSSADANGDGYFDYGWCVEIDPVTRKIKEYGTGAPQKLWALGRMSHENVVVAADRKTVYFGEDDGQGSVYKFVATTADDLSAGTLYVLKLNQPLSNGEPTGNTGTWVQVPNTTPAERNAVKATAASLGGTPFAGVEDVEISPLDGKIYFTVKGLNRVYRFKDDGAAFSVFETFAGARNYRVTTEAGTVLEDWGSGNDNLTFDDRGNLYVLQDGGRNHVWLLRPDHTQENPKVEVFMKTPFGSEPTGMTFTPDFRYMFMSIQSPSAANTLTQADAGGKVDKFNRSYALVVARSSFLGEEQTYPTGISSELTFDLNVYPNPFRDEVQVNLTTTTAGPVSIQLLDPRGRVIATLHQAYAPAGDYTYTLPVGAASLANGLYLCKVTAGNSTQVSKLVRQ